MKTRKQLIKAIEESYGQEVKIITREIYKYGTTTLEHKIRLDGRVVITCTGVSKKSSNQMLLEQLDYILKR